MGSSFGDYDGDGFLDLMVSNYVDLDFHNPPVFGSSPTCKYRGVETQCGPRGLKGAGDALYHNNGDGTFTDVSKQAGVDDPSGYYGLTVAWSDFHKMGARASLSPTTLRRIFCIATKATASSRMSDWSPASP